MTTDGKRGRVMPMSEIMRLVNIDDDPFGDHASKLQHESSQWTDEQWSEHDRKIAEERAREVAEAEARRVREKFSRLEKAGFPLRALRAAETADAQRSAIARVRDWKCEDKSILVLSGPAGCGKTVAAAWWAIRQNWAPAFVRASTFAASSRYDRETREEWFDAPALVLDDLGTEYLDVKGSFLVDLDELLDVFYGNAKPLLITTNADVIAFKTRYGERVSDRVRECGSWFAMRDASMRGKP